MGDDYYHDNGDPGRNTHDDHHKSSKKMTEHVKEVLRVQAEVDANLQSQIDRLVFYKTICTFYIDHVMCH